VLEHGALKSDDDSIVITLRHSVDGIDVEFLDARSPFDPTHKTIAGNAHSGEIVKLGGRGLMLLQAYADEISYVRDGARNRVTLKIKSA
jgi:anti-sigma regulatory factor (Ser/Thr protein kinase)